MYLISQPNLLPSSSLMAITTPFQTPLSTTLSLHHPLSFSKLPFSPLIKPFTLLSLSSTTSQSPSGLTFCSKKDDSEINYLDNDLFNSDESLAYEPPEKPDEYVSMSAIDEPPFESEEEVALAYEELYGPAYSGQTVIGKDVFVMDSKAKKFSGLRSRKKGRIRDGFEETVVQVRRVTKVVKGGKQLKFRAIVVVGDKKGQVGVGCAKAKEVMGAVQKAATDARRNIVTVPMTKHLTFPHRVEAKYGAATVMLRPATPGTGVIAGGAVRTVLEMAGLKNALGKQLGSKNALNNARATVVAVQSMKLFSEVASERGIPMEELWK